MFTFNISHITFLLNDDPVDPLFDIDITIKLKPEIDNVTDVQNVFTLTVVSTDLKKKG